MEPRDDRPVPHRLTIRAAARAAGLSILHLSTAFHERQPTTLRTGHTLWIADAELRAELRVYLQRTSASARLALTPNRDSSSCASPLSS